MKHFLAAAGVAGALLALVMATPAMATSVDPTIVHQEGNPLAAQFQVFDKDASSALKRARQLMGDGLAHCTEVRNAVVLVPDGNGLFKATVEATCATSPYMSFQASSFGRQGGSWRDVLKMARNKLNHPGDGSLCTEVANVVRFNPSGGGFFEATVYGDCFRIDG